MKEFNVDQDLQYKSFEKLLNFKSKEKGLYIFGKPGVGKSTFLLNFAKNIKNQKISIDNFLIDKYKVMYLNVNNWIKDIQKS
ncbi:hypothetical protein [Spiroplasma endosymbiont of Atherix ibis]|uniref:hypothetical protein n=1 Tax=Spiroplasma endosymbiont of Atherix ibis TaxID=3066291 RepID=UPI0030D06D5F